MGEPVVWGGGAGLSLLGTPVFGFEAIAFWSLDKEVLCVVEDAFAKLRHRWPPLFTQQ